MHALCDSYAVTVTANVAVLLPSVVVAMMFAVPVATPVTVTVLPDSVAVALVGADDVTA